MPRMRIHVGSLPYSYGDQELLNLFATFGLVRSARVMRDRETGQSRGFGFVEMDDAEAARGAIAGLNGQRVDAQTLRVSEAREREREAPRDGGPAPAPHTQPLDSAPARSGGYDDGPYGHAGPGAPRHRGREVERNHHQAKKPIKGKGGRGRFDDDDFDSDV